MNIGDKIYCISVTTNAFSRQKIKMVDADGIEWYRYDKPIVEISMETQTIVGKISVYTEGTVEEDEMLENQYYTDTGTKVYESEIGSTSYAPYWITDEETAKKILAQQREKYAD
jgi:hypothetical protein